MSNHALPLNLYATIIRITIPIPLAAKIISSIFPKVGFMLGVVLSEDVVVGFEVEVL